MSEHTFFFFICLCLCTQGLGVCGGGNWQLLLCVGECKDYFGVNFCWRWQYTHSPTHR